MNIGAHLLKSHFWAAASRVFAREIKTSSQSACNGLARLRSRPALDLARREFQCGELLRELFVHSLEHLFALAQTRSLKPFGALEQSDKNITARLAVARTARETGLGLKSASDACADLGHK